jgi:bacillithiol biosynthesis cysteine-adding enzyme BshC
MQKITIHREKSGLFSDLSNELTYNQEKFSVLLNSTFSKEAFSAQIQLKSAHFSANKRSVLVETLKTQYADFPIQVEVNQNIDSLLNEQTFTITTGHQLNLLTGPIYFIYKILHVIRLAEELKKMHPKNHFVPVYWMASEDHDFEEINHTRLFGKEIRWENAQGGPVGEYDLTDWQLMKETVEAFFQNNPESEVNDVLKSYNGKDLASATKSLIHKLFGKYGLVIIEPNYKSLKNEFVKIMQQEVQSSFAEKAVLKANQVIEDLGFKTQVFPREINLFYIQKGIRERLVIENGNIVIPSLGTFSKEEICNQIAENPQNFSPNVVLRPVYQECILPNLVYVGGGGEMAYWLQFKGVFDTCGVPFPLIQVRNSIQLIDANTQKKLAKLNLESLSIFRDLNDLKKDFILENSGDSLNFDVLDQLTNQMIALFHDQITEVDASLKPFAAAEEVKLQKQMEGIKAKLVKQQKLKFDNTMKQLEDIHEKMFPMNSVQERVDNFFSFCAQGEVYSVLENLKKAIDPWEKDLIVLNLD